MTALVTSGEHMSAPEKPKGKANQVNPLRISRDFTVLLLSLVTIGLGFGILSPIMPILAEERLMMSEFEMGLTFAMFFVSMTVFVLPAGYWADKFGRKRILVAGVLIFSVTTFALAFITDIYQFAALRFLEGFGAALATPATFALTADIVPEGRRGVAMGAEGTAEVLGAMGGPGIGGLLASWLGLNAPFFFAAGLALVCALLILQIRAPKVVLSEKKPSMFAIFQSWKRNASHNKALYAVTARGCVMGVVQGLFSLGLLLYWYNEIGLNETEVGLAMSVGMFAMMVGTLPAGIIADRIGRRPNMIIGGAIMVTGLVLNLWVTDFWQVVVIVAIGDIGASISNPAVGAMLADIMLEEERGRVIGAYHAFQGMGNIVGFVLLGFLYEVISPEAPIVLCTVMLIVATGIIALFVAETRKSPVKTDGDGVSTPPTRAADP